MPRPEVGETANYRTQLLQADTKLPAPITAQGKQEEKIEQSEPAPQRAASQETDIAFLKLVLCIQFMQVGYTVMEGCGKTLINGFALDAIDFAFARNFFMWLASIGLTRHCGLDSIRQSTWKRNKRALLLSGLAGTGSMILTNLSMIYLPLTIFFVLVCSSPFFIAIAAYFFLDEKMTVAAIVATVLSFGAIIMLTLSNPAEDEDSADGSSQSTYVKGVIFALLNVLCLVTIALTTRRMRDVHPYLILRNYNGFGVFLVGTWLVAAWILKGKQPFDFSVTLSSAVLLLMSCASHLMGLLLMFHVNQKAQPSLVSLISYTGILWRLLSDLLFFDLVPNRGQSIAILLLLSIQIGYMVYNLRAGGSPAPSKSDGKSTDEVSESETQDDVYHKV